ncbi:hypothetical protein [Terriglobus aquaticus]|uniref:DUF3106 domain-containing protein n=1 Tax=Terriglobus aquaticus TaxID=940139 RepID=A0ABW9KHX2_9BACT|nr:hypothetical protein [Terriglobus aquaticus]
MNEPEERTPADDRLDAVLTALGTARPEDGLEQRLARRLAQVPGRETTPARWVRFRPALTLASAGVLAAVALAALLVNAPRQPDERSSAKSPSMPRANSLWVAVPEPAPVISPKDAERKEKWPHVATMHQPQASVLTANASTSARGSADEASFPAPKMLLTEQERLLLRVAHRNDPEEIAMLDPVQRDLTLARERAESTKFFAPEPLSPEMQQEIKAALRSQYVNTPPPPELADSTSDRSTR